MKKIAFLFGGRITSYEQQKEYLLKLQKQYNADFFLSLNTDSLNTEQNDFIKDFDVKLLYYCKYDRQKDIENFNFGCNLSNNFYNACSMFYNNYMAFQLLTEYQKINNFTYDVVVKFRADIVSDENFIIDDYIKSKTVYIPKNNDWRGGINDQIAYGDYASMLQYCNLYNNFETIKKHTNIFHPETNLKIYLNICNLDIIRVDYNYSLNSDRTK